MPRTRSLSSWVVSLAAAGCAAPPVAPVSVDPVRAERGQRVEVDHALLVVDGSSSVAEEFPGEKALLRSLVASMPAGPYEAGAIQYGGLRRDTAPLADFDRGELAGFAEGLSHLGEGSPLYAVLAEAGGMLEGRRGEVALTVVGDGRPTDPFGREVPYTRTIDAAKDLVDRHPGRVCIHTVQVGDDTTGTSLLKQLAAVTGCGSHRSADSLTRASSLQAFQREVFLTAAPPPPPAPVAKPVPGDRDGDGVADDRDRCAGTPSGARVDERGCWVIEGLRFATDSAEIGAESRARLDREVVPVIRRARGIRLRIDGHTDSRGSEPYNQALSERRARAVRDYLVSQGVPAGRLEYRGFGEARPVAPNDTPANLRKNRRTELTVLGRGRGRGR